VQLDAEYWIAELGLEAHPEGGYFKETFRSAQTLPESALGKLSGDRSASTAIYFLVTAGHPSHFHRLATDEVWHHYAGDPLELVFIHPDGALESKWLGKDIAGGCLPQVLAPAGSWFGGRVHAQGGYALCGCTMAPGFDFADFELAERNALAAAHPQHAAIVTALTREA
jgi:predicted cupin superfamily sugar epimerase